MTSTLSRIFERLIYEKPKKQVKDKGCLLWSGRSQPKVRHLYFSLSLLASSTTWILYFPTPQEHLHVRLERLVLSSMSSTSQVNNSGSHLPPTTLWWRFTLFQIRRNIPYNFAFGTNILSLTLSEIFVILDHSLKIAIYPEVPPF